MSRVNKGQLGRTILARLTDRQTDRQMQWLPEAEYKESENVQHAKACRPKLSDTQCNGRHGNKLRGFPYSQTLWQ